MGFFSKDLSGVPDLTHMEEGEYDLRITSVKDVEAGNGRDGIRFVCKILNEENAKNVVHQLWAPMEGDDEDNVEIMERMQKEFLQALNMPVDGSVENDDFVNLEFSAILGIEEYEGEERNKIVKIT